MYREKLEIMYRVMNMPAWFLGINIVQEQF